VPAELGLVASASRLAVGERITPAVPIDSGAPVRTGSTRVRHSPTLVERVEGNRIAVVVMLGLKRVP
jgi:hypothetical protein